MKKDDDKDVWPDFYPSDLALPPKDASDVSTEEMLYRLVKSIPPTEMCFLATHQEQPNRHKKCHTLEQKQAVYGTSVWDSRELLVEVMASLPEALKQHKLACGTISAGMGKIRKTLVAGHLTLWLKKNSRVHLNFSEVK
ncbi:MULTISPECIES: hypothetical protein [Aeromonas]|uniref:hypothetical protein n=1 Tax=Aeromonas TaxID=642 RepID=UPI000F768BA0|nr:MULTISPECIES: hypothetical protein [Aeromonas]MCU9925236.1 hypothetical protein [Aeromonas caviae]RSM28428.1 hypothetical protein C5B76_07380 [Aeromonas salmonicida]TNI11227.1 hypothetical protein CF106_15825 [Aeromonas veronii]